MAKKQDARDPVPDEPETTARPARGEEPAGTTKETVNKAAKKKIPSKDTAKKKAAKKTPGEEAGKKTARKKGEAPPVADRPAVGETGGPTEEEIRRRAYEIWEQRGREPGREEAHWIEAERQLREESA